MHSTTKIQNGRRPKKFKMEGKEVVFLIGVKVSKLSFWLSKRNSPGTLVISRKKHP